MRYILTAIAAACTVFAGAAESPVVPGLSDSGKVRFNRAFGEPAEDGSRFRIDTTQAPDAWNRVCHTAEKVLKPDTEYTAIFRYKVDKTVSNGYLLFVCRPLGSSGDKFDTFSAQCNGEAANMLGARLHFKTGSRPDYALQLYTFRKVLGELADFTLWEGRRETVYPLFRDYSTGDGAPERVPTGAAEFEVQKPASDSGVTVRAAEFGFDPAAADNTEALNRAIAECAARGASKLELAPGVFKMRANSSVMFKNLKDLEIDGRGAVLQFLTDAEWLIVFRECERVFCHDLACDWDIDASPLASIVKVEAVGKDSVDLRFLVPKKFPENKLRISVLSSFDPKTCSVGVENGRTRYLQFWAHNPMAPYEWLAPDLLRLRTDPAVFTPGRFFRAQHFYYDHHMFRILNCKNLTLENVDVRGVPGHAFFIDGESSYLAFRRVNVTIPKGEEKRRAISCTADHIHIARSQGFLKFEECDLGYGGDDCINVHDCVAGGNRISDDTIRTVNFPYIWSYTEGDECEIRFGDYSTAVERTRIKSIRQINSKVAEITFDSPIPEAKEPGALFLIFNWKFDSRNVIVRNCFIHDNRANGMRVQGRDITLEGNRFFHNEMSAIRIETIYNQAWAEGYGVSNLVLRNNVFDRVNPVGVQENGRVRDLVMAVSVSSEPFEDKNSIEKVIRDVLFENNVFRNSFGLAVHISTVENVIFRNNTFLNDMTRRDRHPYRGGFYLENVSGAEFTGNTYVESPYVRMPEIICADGSVENLTVKGNRIVKAAPEK